MNGEQINKRLKELADKSLQAMDIKYQRLTSRQKAFINSIPGAIFLGPVVVMVPPWDRGNSYGPSELKEYFRYRKKIRRAKRAERKFLRKVSKQ